MSDDQAWLGERRLYGLSLFPNFTFLKRETRKSLIHKSMSPETFNDQTDVSKLVEWLKDYTFSEHEELFTEEYNFVAELMFGDNVVKHLFERKQTEDGVYGTWKDYGDNSKIRENYLLWMKQWRDNKLERHGLKCVTDAYLKAEKKIIELETERLKGGNVESLTKDESGKVLFISL